MAYIGKKPEDLIKGNASYNAFTGDGSTTTFDVTNLLPDGGQFDVEVFVDNVRQEAGASKSYTIGQDGSGDLKRITFNVAPGDGSEIYVINPGRETSLITVADNAISTAKIIADAVTGAKIADDAVDSEHLVDGSVDNVHLSGSIANSKLANSSITINGTAVSLGGSVVAGTDWQAVVVADGSTQLTAVAGRGYFLDTNLGVIDVKLPTNPSRGDTFVFADYANNFATNRVVIDTGGKLIDSTVGGEPGSGGFALETNGQVVELVFVDDTSGYLVKQNSAPSDLSADSYAEYIEATGGTITTSGNFKIHTFTGDGNFVVSDGGNAAGSNSVSYVVVAGGGSGGLGSGASDRGSGGGAGGYREGKATSDSYTASPIAATSGVPVSASTTYPITVGGGGAEQGSNAKGNNGSNSVFSTITSTGGGGGGHQTTQGNDGGSGGGFGGGSGSGTPLGGAGNTPPVSPPQGNPGGRGGSPSAAPNIGGGGGGGATQAGADAGPGAGGNGGAGATSCITGSPVERAGGGGGDRGADSSGGGSSGPGQDLGGTANTGGGGQGGYPGGGGNGGAGGKGVVIIRYKFQN